jgi:hypothetical protein
MNRAYKVEILSIFKVLIFYNMLIPYVSYRLGEKEV